MSDSFYLFADSRIHGIGTVRTDSDFRRILRNFRYDARIHEVAVVPVVCPVLVPGGLPHNLRHGQERDGVQQVVLSEAEPIPQLFLRLRIRSLHLLHGAVVIRRCLQDHRLLRCPAQIGHLSQIVRDRINKEEQIGYIINIVNFMVMIV